MLLDGPHPDTRSTDPAGSEPLVAADGGEAGGLTVHGPDDLLLHWGPWQQLPHSALDESQPALSDWPRPVSRFPAVISGFSGDVSRPT